jgi:hypothetical protein
VRFQEILRRLAMIDEGFVEDEAGLGLDPAAMVWPARVDGLAGEVTMKVWHRTGSQPIRPR